MEEELIPYLTERLSDETILHILKSLESHEDFVNLSQTCHKLNILLQDRQLCSKIRFHWNLRNVSRVSLTKFLRDKYRACVITSLNLSDLYWLPSGLIKDVAVGMVNLKELLVAGTPFSWNHLQQTLKAIPTLEKLSWSWDNFLEESVRKRSTIPSRKYAELIEMKPQFLQLKCLLVHVPMNMKASTDLIFCSFTSFTYLVSLCTNLEQLWLVSWPKSSPERKSSSNLNSCDVVELDLPFLHTLVISVKQPPRITTPKLIGQLISNLLRNNSKPKVLWLDHPLLLLAPRHVVPAPAAEQAPAVAGIVPGGRMNRSGSRDRHWPQEIDLSEAEQISYPLTYHASGDNDIIIQKQYAKVRKLLVSHGAPFVVSLNGVFDSSAELESFCCSTFNLRLNWRRFALNHQKLKEVSISESEGSEDHCIALATLPQLQKLSIPVECLLEIRDAQAVSDYRIFQLTDEKSNDCEKLTGPMPTNIISNPDNEQGLFKKRRVGVPSKPSADSSRVSGLHLLTAGCKNINELEIGLGKAASSTKAGRILAESLFSISRWKNLSKISLNGLPIMDGKFLIAVTSSCKLTSMRLSHLGSSGHCCYINDLCKALSSCNNLVDFRLEQNYIGTSVHLLNSLQSCIKLRRVLIWSSPNNIPLQPESVEGMFENCPDLMMFYATIEPTTKVVCKSIKKHIEAKYRPSRPGLSVVIGSTLQEDGLINYPSIHYRQMVVREPQVCELTNFPDFNSGLF